MSSPEARADYPDQDQRAAVAYSFWEHRNMLLNASDEGWARGYSARFIEPGLVGYAEHGMVLVQKPVLDKMAKSFVGKPVINEVHKDVDPSVYKNGEADGTVTRVWYNEEDGWYWCDFVAWDPLTQRNCESGAYFVSCAYKVTNTDEQAGEYHNIPYHQEVLDGSYTHLAVVSNPRYEGARIVYNSKGGTMKLFNLFKKGEAKSAADMEKAVVDVDGKKVTVKELVELHNSVEASKALENMSDDTIIEVDGKEMPLKNLKDTYRATIKNAEDDEKKKKEDEERKNAEDEEKKAKEEEERKNADEAEKKKKADEEEMKNKKHFADLKNAAELRGEPQKPNLRTRREMAEEGKKLYGKVA